jgi:hypothetical protein
MLLMLPFVYAARSIGYSWAVSQAHPVVLGSHLDVKHGGETHLIAALGFSPLSPLIISQLGLAAITFFLLVVQHGWEESRLLFRCSYTSLIVTGTLAGSSFCLQNMALTHVAPTTLTVLMSTQTVTTGFFQGVLLRECPSKTQWASLLAGLMLAIEYTLYRAGHVTGGGDFIGVLCGVFAASCLALGGLAFQYFVAQFTSKAQDKDAEVKRLIIANEIWKVPISLGLLFATDADRVIHFGFFYGWNWNVAFGACFLSLCMVGYRLLAISICGALAATVAASAEVAVVWLLDVYVLESTKLLLSDVFTLGALILVVLAFNLSRQEVLKARTNTLIGMTDDLDRISRSLTQVCTLAAEIDKGKYQNDQLGRPNRRQRSAPSSIKFSANDALTEDVRLTFAAHVASPLEFSCSTREATICAESEET